MIKLSWVMILIFMSAASLSEEVMSIEMLTFLASYTNEDGDWDGPELIEKEAASESLDKDGEDE